MPQPTPTIRLMTPADVPFAMELKNFAKWNQVEADWLGYLAFEPDGCFVAEVGATPAGTATTITYEGQVGWIGMVLVHPEHRRRGVGTALLEHRIAHLRGYRGRGIDSIKLDATAMGKPVYTPLGFVEEYELTRYEGVMPAAPERPADKAIARINVSDVEELATFDRIAFGVNREKVLRSLAARQPEWSLLARDSTGRIAGYLMAHEGYEAVQLGPAAAVDAAMARQLFTEAARRMPGRRVFLDVPQPNREGTALVEGLGFTPQRGFTRMVLGDNRSPGRPELIYATSGAEKG